MGPSSFCLSHDRPVTWRCVEARNTNFGEPANWEDNKLMSQNNHPIEIWVPVSFIDQRWGQWRSKIKRPLILQISPRMTNLRQGILKEGCREAWDHWESPADMQQDPELPPSPDPSHSPSSLLCALGTMEHNKVAVWRASGCCSLFARLVCKRSAVYQECESVWAWFTQAACVG